VGGGNREGRQMGGKMMRPQNVRWSSGRGRTKTNPIQKKDNETKDRKKS